MKKNLFLSNLKIFLKKQYTDNKKIFFLTIFLIVAFVFVGGYSLFSTSKSNKKASTKNHEAISISEYSSKIESKLISMLQPLNEIESIDAFVMVDSTPTYKYLTEVEESSTPSTNGVTTSKSETVVFEKNGSVSTPVVITTLAPKISGVLIVVNKISASTKLAIINSVSIVLNINPECISILQER